METFKIRENSFKEIRKSILIKTIPVFLLTAFGGVAIGYYSISAREGHANFPFMVLPLILAVLIFSIYRGINRQKKIFNTYRLIIDDENITREQYNTPTIVIAKSDIYEIILHSSGGFIIKGPSAHNFIGVPAQIEEYEKVEKLLSEIKPISIKKESFFYKFRLVIVLFIIGMFATVAIAENKIIVGISGSLLLIFMIYSLILVVKNKNIDDKTKKASWWSIIVMLSIAGAMIFKIFIQ